MRCGLWACRRGGRAAALAVVAATVSFGPALAAPKFTVIHKFAGGAKGERPNGALTIGPNGVLYGTTLGGGPASQGTAFTLTPPTTAGGAWTHKVIYGFTAGASAGQPLGGLVMGPGSVFYGTSLAGGVGRGTVYMLKASGATWSVKVLHAFRDASGVFPQDGLIRDASGRLYGTAAGGGPANFGTVFRLTPPASGAAAWKTDILHRFPGGAGGRYPQAALTFGPSGILYGTTSAGGASDRGTVFQLTPKATPPWTPKVIHAFTGAAGGGLPVSPMVRDGAGNLYGTTVGSDNPAIGTVFELVKPASGTTWTHKILHRFKAGTADGAVPFGHLRREASGVLWGATMGGGSRGKGTVWRLAPPAAGKTAWTETIPKVFTEGADGGVPRGGLVADAKGVLYGTTTTGGLGHGVVFKIEP